MIAIDSNILVYAMREDSPHHARANLLVRELAQGELPWAIPAHCLVEFTGIITHPRLYKPPTPLDDALEQIRYWRACPSLRVLSENPLFWHYFSLIAKAANVRGPEIHDVRIAALCLANGVTELWSADRDFKAFPELTVRNPL